MPRLRFAVLARFSSALCLAGLLVCAQAAELGEVIVRSHIGQPLVADIELTQLAEPSVPVVVRLAHPDVYRGANIAVHPVLSSLNMSVMRRDGRQFLHITSVKQVDSQYVHLFLELTDGGKRTIRTETLWLTPDPTPAPPPRPAAAPEPAPVPAPVAAPAPRPSSLPRPTTLLEPGGRVLRVPSATPAPSCPSAEQVKACAAIDYKNGLLSAQIVELEEKVKALELAMKSAAGAAAPAASAAKPAVKAPSAPPAPPKPAPKKKDGFPWLLVGAAVALLAAIGGAVLFVLRRRKAGSAGDAAPDAAAWHARVMARLRRKPKQEAPVEPELPKET